MLFVGHTPYANEKENRNEKEERRSEGFSRLSRLFRSLGSEIRADKFCLESKREPSCDLHSGRSEGYTCGVCVPLFERDGRRWFIHLLILENLFVWRAPEERRVPLPTLQRMLGGFLN